MRSLAFGTSAWFFYPPSFSKMISAPKASSRRYDETFPPRLRRPRNMGKVIVDYLLPNTKGSRDFQSCHWSLFQKVRDLLSDRFLGTPIISIHLISP